jgi:O-antigen ligase
MMQKLLIVAFALAALLVGWLAGTLGGIVAAAFVAGLVFALLLLRDYRVGVIALMVIIPFLGTHDQGSNVFLLALAATGSIFLIHKLFKREPIVGLPKVAWLGIVPAIAWGAFLAVQHLDEARALLAYTPLEAIYSGKGYFRFAILYPFGIIASAWLLANAIHDSKKPERFFVAVALTGGVIVLRILHLVATSGMGLSELGSSGNREIFSQLGHHANTFGPMLAIAAGPFLFLTADSRGWSRVFYGTTLLFLVAGCALVFSRGGYLAFMVVFATFLFMRRGMKLFIGVAVACAVALVVAPDAVIDRAMTGLDSRSVAMAAAGSDSDALTAGRFAIYARFLPDIEKSPIWGSGTNSGGWSNAVRYQGLLAMHPHNTYLRIVMDIGILGLLALGFFWWGIARHMKALAGSAAISPTMRSYFAGAFAGVLGMVAAGLSGGPHWLPEIGHAFMWYSIGMVFAFWKPAEAALHEARPIARRRTGRHPIRSRESTYGSTSPVRR